MPGGSFHRLMVASLGAGNVILDAVGCRKVWWTRPGMGKRCDARVIYFNPLEHGEVVVEGVRESKVRQPVRVFLKQLREAIEHG